MVTAAEAHTLGNQLQSDPTKHANNVVTLLACIKPDAPEAAAKAAIQALKLYFVTACDAGDIGRHKRQKISNSSTAAAADEEDAAAQAASVYHTWQQRQYGVFTTALLTLLHSPVAPALQAAALSALLECVRHDAGPATFSAPLFQSTLTACLLSPHLAPEVFAALLSRYLHYGDVRYHTLRVVSRLAASRAVRSSSSSKAAQDNADEEEDQQQKEAEAAAPPAAELAAVDVARNMYDVLAALPASLVVGETGLPSSWCGAAEAGLVAPAADAAASAKLRRKRKAQAAAAAAAGGGVQAGATPVAWANPKVQQRAYQGAWLAFLQVDLPGDVYRKVLLKLHGDVIPVMTDPALLADFLTHALGRGGLDGMLALHGIFTLVTRHGLEYPAFYTRLYQLITPAALRSKHRVQFFKLADVFLASGLVPAYSAAAFAKRFARLALAAPPAAAMMCVAFVHNIIRRHPSCMVLLHKPQRKAAGGAGAEPLLQGQGGEQAAAGVASAVGQDVYDEGQADPAASRAVESSLWELEALRHHYCPQVATFVLVLDKDLGDRARTAEVDVQPLLTASTAELLSGELSRRLKSAPLAFYKQQPTSVWGTRWDAQGLGTRSEGQAGMEDLPGWDLASS